MFKLLMLSLMLIAFPPNPDTGDNLIQSNSEITETSAFVGPIPANDLDVDRLLKDKEHLAEKLVEYKIIASVKQATALLENYCIANCDAYFQMMASECGFNNTPCMLNAMIHHSACLAQCPPPKGEQ